MTSPKNDRQEVARRGRERYERELRALVEPVHHGKFLVVDVDTGDYEIDREDIAAIKRAKAKRPGAALYILRVGYPTAYRLGGHFKVSGP